MFVVFPLNVFLRHSSVKEIAYESKLPP
uniref:Uncharacterized protein n=1 Tax=Anguilla anguilla TaxID=7936 RepID=A0A0E9WC28_ANGAN